MFESLGNFIIRDCGRVVAVIVGALALSGIFYLLG